MSVSSMSLSSRASKRRIDEIDDTIDAIAESIKDMQHMDLHSKLLCAKLKKEKLVALQAVARSQMMLAKMEVLIAENELGIELAQLKNCKELKKCNNDRSRKKERSKPRKPQSQTHLSKREPSSVIPITIKENTHKQNKSLSPVQAQTKSNSSLDGLKLAISQKHEIANKTVELMNAEPLTPAGKEPLSCSIDKVANKNINNEFKSCVIDKVTRENNLKPVALVRNEPLSPPNIHTNLNNISKLVMKSQSSKCPQKHALKNSTQSLNNTDRFETENISKIELSQHSKILSHSGHLKNKPDNTKNIVNTQANQNRKVSQHNPHPVHVKKPIGAKINNRDTKERKIKKNDKNINGNKMDPTIHQLIINDLFKEIMQSKTRSHAKQSKSDDQVPHSVVSDKTPLLCFKCGLVNEDHMCEYTIREILENC